MCNNLNARSGLSVGYKKESSRWKKHDGSAIPGQFSLDWISAYSSIGNYMSLECYRDQSHSFGRLFDRPFDRPFICQYI